jgi:uncharacterized protein (DUF2249 family)
VTTVLQPAASKVRIDVAEHDDWSAGRVDAGGPRPSGPKCLLKRRRTAMTDTSSTADVIDVRSLVPAERHAKIFELVNAMQPGASFILVNDHDPKPLYYQMEAEYPGQFSWAYVEQGPQVWRVEIGKHAKAA